MPRLSKLLEKIEDLAANRWGSWYERNKARVPLYAVLGGLGWYFYGMLLNSLRLGKESVFHMTGEKVESIWVLNPFKNFFVVLTPFGLGTTAVIVLLICLLTRKGYKWFSGYHSPGGDSRHLRLCDEKRARRAFGARRRRGGYGDAPRPHQEASR
mgnify:CR=1 FL=1